MNRHTTKHQWRMKESESGEWVRYSEVETLKAEHQDQIADLADYYGRQIAKEYAEKLFYKQKLELLGHLPVALLGAGLVLCLGYSFDWQF